VSTTKDFRYGIDWNVLAKRLSGEVLTDARRGKELRLETAVTNIAAPTLTITRTAADISAVLRALEEQGDVKVLANPYIFARNLQPVAIFSGKSIPYISSIQRTVTGVVGEATTSFEIARAQDGIMLAVRTYVRDDGDIDVQIMPILSSIDEFVTFNVEGNVFTNPVSSVQQTMQSVTVSDGETVVIGGVKRERAEAAEKSVPLLSNIPLLGSLFRSEAEIDSRSELVIALKVKKVDRTTKSR
jgi:type II secretory pathway component GspD/PulD (secretin)